MTCFLKVLLLDQVATAPVDSPTPLCFPLPFTLLSVKAHLICLWEVLSLHHSRSVEFLQKTWWRRSQPGTCHCLRSKVFPALNGSGGEERIQREGTRGERPPNDWRLLCHFPSDRLISFYLFICFPENDCRPDCKWKTPLLVEGLDVTGWRIQRWDLASFCFRGQSLCNRVPPPFPPSESFV